ncbi:MAG: helix-turn-helix transcriptional regulator [Bacteriovoracaceae bacterium]
MSKRIKKVMPTRESETLIKLRKKQGLSLRKLADLMEISFSRVHQMESGRDDLNEEYLEKFLSVLGLNREDWEFHIGANYKIEPLRDQCFEILKTLEPGKLEKAYLFLSDL